MFNTRSIARLALLFACINFAAVEGRSDSITLNPSTSLLNGTNFTVGQTYYAVFQLVGGGTDNNSILLSNFNFAGASALARDPSDPSSGTFVLGPIPSDASGIGQAGSTLQLLIVPGDAFALFSQRFIASSAFSFDFALTSNFMAGNSYDAFTFQLYDTGLTTLLYEQQFDITGSEPVPEPAALLLLGSGLSGFAAVVRRRTRLARTRMREQHCQNGER